MLTFLFAESILRTSVIGTLLTFIVTMSSFGISLLLIFSGHSGGTSEAGQREAIKRAINTPAKIFFHLLLKLSIVLLLYTENVSCSVAIKPYFVFLYESNLHSVNILVLSEKFVINKCIFFSSVNHNPFQLHSFKGVSARNFGCFQVLLSSILFKSGANCFR